MNEVVDYYSSYHEDGRLFKDNGHQIEWITTTKYLEKYLTGCTNVFDL